MSFETFFRIALSQGSFTNFTRSFVLAGEGRISPQLAFFHPQKVAIAEKSEEFIKLNIIPLGYREYCEFGNAASFKKPKIFRIAMFGLFSYGEEEFRFGCILLKTLEFPKIIQLGSCLAFGYKLVIKPIAYEEKQEDPPLLPSSLLGTPFGVPLPVKYPEETLRSNYENAHNIHKDNSAIAHWFSSDNLKQWFFISTSTEPGLLTYQDHAALVGFVRLFSIVEFNTDFYPFTQPIENPEEIITRLAFIQNSAIRTWCEDRINQLLVHENAEIRRLAALYVKATPKTP